MRSESLGNSLSHQSRPRNTTARYTDNTLAVNVKFTVKLSVALEGEKGMIAWSEIHKKKKINRASKD